MASYRGHLAFATALGAAYGGAAYYYGGMSWVTAAMGGALTGISGMLPDLDSDSGVPSRTLFAGAGVLVPLLSLRRILAMDLPVLKSVGLIVGLYVLIRYGAAWVFRRLTVHRGMFHSIPGMLIAGFLVFLCYHDPDVVVRYFLAIAVMLCFLSHLVLDELCSVDLHGAHIKLNKFSGSAVKFFSPSWTATAAAWALLLWLAYLATPDVEASRGQVKRFVATWGVPRVATPQAARP